jgi:23S rRNA pseudouridine1911/1915/1917 synthase
MSNEEGAARSHGRRRVVRIEPGADGQRADSFLASLWKVSVAEARRRWVATAVRVDGRLARKGDRLAVGAELEFEEPTTSSNKETGTTGTGIRPDASIELMVLYCDAHLVAVDKPAGIASHPLGLDEIGTAASAIVARFPECAAASPDAREGGLVHRLDHGTSGVLLAARSRAAWMSLRQALGAEACNKRYLAEVNGHPPPVGRIDAAIGRTGRAGGTVRVGGGGRRPLAAETRWRVVTETKDTALVVAELHRGRPHQVRAHLAAAGFPLVGDTRYGAPRPLTDAEFHLHAWSVSFVHPVTGEALVISAPLPEWAKAAAQDGFTADGQNQWPWP